MFLSSVNNNFFLLQVWAMKSTELKNIWYISVRVTYTKYLNIKKNLNWKLGFRVNVYVMSELQTENNRVITSQI